MTVMSMRTENKKAGVVLWRSEEVASYLDITTTTLSQWRHRNAGPPYIRVGGAIRYRLDDVDVWLDDHSEARKNLSTAEDYRKAVAHYRAKGTELARISDGLMAECEARFPGRSSEAKS